MINIYALKGCDKCSSLVNELKKEGINHSVIYDDVKEELFDELEDKLDCFNYPIVEFNNIGLNLEISSKISYIISSECKTKHSYIVKYDDIYDIINILKTI